MPCIPGYRTWLHSRTGTVGRPSGGIAVLVHDSLGAAVSLWQTAGHHVPSPHHFWLRFDGGPRLQRPLLLAAAYLPPTSSKYGLRRSPERDDYFLLLGDEVAAAMAAAPGGTDVLLAGDFNAHTGNQQDFADHSALLQAALDVAAEDVLVPCSQQDAACDPPPRASTCTAPVCAQGTALLQLCCATGMLLLNGRVHGDVPAQPTCFTGHCGSVIDYLVGSASLLAQAAELRVLPQVPEYRGHRPLELTLGLPTPSTHPAAQHAAPNPDSDSCAPPPSFALPLRISPDGLEQFASELQQPATAAQLQQLAHSANSDPLQAAAQLHALLYSTAAAVFPPASNSGPRRQPQRDAARQLRKRHQPWFDAECEAARQQIRQQTLDSMLSGQPSHLAKQALRELTNRYTRLRRRKAAAWQRQRGTALLQMQRHNPAKFFRQWRQRHGDAPIDAAALRRHFASLAKRTFQPSGSGSGSSSTTSPASQPAPATDSQPSPDATLDSDITCDDVTTALKKLSPSSASLGPLKAALIKAGSDSLTPVLAQLFTAVFRSGRFPPDWALGAITPIHKKGDTTDPNNYRGITVGHVLGKLYAIVINNRLTDWLESRGLRAKGQAGFRKGYRTVDNCFILRALVERARARGVKLYLCAVDFEKAFDSVDRPLLWAALQRAGIGGSMLPAIQAMYADVPVCVKTAEGLSSCFQSALGVKQGCPLSPLLFGIFLDDFESHLQLTAGEAGCLPQLAGHTVPPLLFADDMLLVATSPAGLNAQLGSLQAYCDAKKLTVNTAKTQVMIFRPGGGGSAKLAAGEAFTYAGRQLEVVKHVKYLGLTFAQLSKRHGFSCCADTLAKAGKQALFAMRRRAWELGACLVEQQLQLFDILVQPVLSYGCEVWGVDLLDRADCASERVHRWFCRRVQGLPKQAASAVSLAELGRQPLHLFWVQQLARFWNRLQASMSEPDRLLGRAFEDNLALMREGTDLASGSPCWCRRWQQFLQSAPTDSGTFVWLTELQEGAVAERAAAAYYRQSLEPAQPNATTTTTTTTTTIRSSTQQQHSFATQPAAQHQGGDTAVAPLAVPGGVGGPAVGRPRDSEAPPLGQRRVGFQPSPVGRSVAPSDADAPPAAVATGSTTTKFAYYLHCIRGDLPLNQPSPHLLEVSDCKHRISLSRFRTSCHDLRIERERYLPQALKAPRHERTCLQCASACIEDESHMIFQCPIYDDLRFQYADLFSPDMPHSTACFLTQDQNRVAAFIHDCSVLRRRNACMSLAGSESASL